MSWKQTCKRLLSYDKEPWFDYTRVIWLGVIYLLGLSVTVLLAYIFSFRESINLPHFAGITLGVIFLSLAFQTLRESGLAKRTEDAETLSAQKQEEYEAKIGEMANKQLELNALAKELNQSQQDLSQLLKTMPPPHALSSFTESFNFVLQLWRSRAPEPKTVAEAKATLQQYEEWVRICLNAIARLFLQYEHKPITSKCSAHFAQYFPMEDLNADPDLLRRALEGLRFVDYPKKPMNGLDGVLCINPAFSAFSEPKNQTSRNPDPQLKEEFFLPIPEDDGDVGGRSRFLPIAPQALKHGLVSIPDVAEGITKEAAENWNVTTNVMEDVLAYFRGGEHGRMGSVVGYRLIWDDSDPEAPDPAEVGIKLGVLTLFTETRNSKDGAVLTSFFDLVRPIVEMTKTFVVGTMEIRAKLRTNEYEPDSPTGD